MRQAVTLEDIPPHGYNFILGDGVKGGDCLTSIAKELFFQHDGDPLHFGTQVRESLNENMPDRWIGRRGTIDWPPRSPDLTPIDYFLWIYMKNKVYKRKFRKMEELKSRIKEEFDALKSNKPMLKRIASSINTRVSECIKQNGEKIDT